MERSVSSACTGVVKGRGSTLSAALGHREGLVRGGWSALSSASGAQRGSTKLALLHVEDLSTLIQRV